MTFDKRALDIGLALFLTIVLSPFILTVAVLILLRDGRPILYVSERMTTPDTAFGLVKFRTMTLAHSDSGVTGADKSDRITRTGRLLRRTRLDELPQLWNVLRGDMSFVGPRPPLRQYVDAFPEVYAEVLRSRPGITGLASLVYADHEAMLLSRSTSDVETDVIYRRAAVPRKARLDLMWQANRTLCFDLWIMWQTVVRRLR